MVQITELEDDDVVQVSLGAGGRLSGGGGKYAASRKKIAPTKLAASSQGDDGAGGGTKRDQKPCAATNREPSKRTTTQPRSDGPHRATDGDNATKIEASAASKKSSARKALDELSQAVEKHAAHGGPKDELAGLFCRRADHLLANGDWEDALQDFLSAAEAAPGDVSAHLGAARACFHKGDFRRAVDALERRPPQPKGEAPPGAAALERDAELLLRRARAAAALDTAGAAAAIAAEKQRTDLAEWQPTGKGADKAPLLAVESLVRTLWRDNIALSAAAAAPPAARGGRGASATDQQLQQQHEAQQSATHTLLQLAHELKRAAGPDAAHARALFHRLKGYTVALRYLRPPTVSPALAVLLAAPQPSAGAAAELAREAVSADTPQELATVRLRLLQQAAAEQGARLTAIAPDVIPGGANQVNALRVLTDAATCEAALKRLHAEGVSALVGVLDAFSLDATSRAAAVATGAAPMAALLSVFNCAEDLDGIRLEGADTLPPKVEQCRSPEEAQRWLAVARARYFNRPAVELRRKCLTALQRYAGDPASLRAEAFERRSQLGKDAKKSLLQQQHSTAAAPLVVGSRLLPDLLSALKALSRRAPTKTAPLLDFAGKPKAFAKRKFAADFDDNPTGDLLPRLPEARAGGDGAQAGIVFEEASGEKVSIPGAGGAEPPLIELCLDCLIGAVGSAPTMASRVLFKAGAVGALEDLWEFNSDKVSQKASRLGARLALGCKGAAEALREGAAMQAPVCLLRAQGSAELQLAGAERLAQMVSTASGDEFFGFFTAAGGPLEAAHALLCALDAEGRSDGASRRLHSELRQLFLRCLERARAAQGSAASGSPPTKGSWAAIGPEEVLRMESLITGKPLRRPGAGAAARSCAASAASASAAAGSPGSEARGGKPGGAAGAAPATPPSGVVARAPSTPPQQLQAAPSEAARGKRFPWDPAPAAGSSAPARPGASAQQQARGTSSSGSSRTPATTSSAAAAVSAGQQPLIRKGFLTAPRRRGGSSASPASAAAATSRVPAAAADPAESAEARERAAAAAMARAAGAFEEPWLAAPANEADYYYADEEEWEDCGSGAEVATSKATKKPPAAEPEEGAYDEDGLRVAFDSSGNARQRVARSAWLKMDLREKITWTQTSGEIEVHVRVPKGTKAREVSVTVTPTRLTVTLGWHGRVVDGPLFRRCKASEAAWGLEGDDVTILLPKDDTYFWKALFEGGEEKSHFEVLRELVSADEAAPAFEDLDDRGRDLVEDIREYQAMVNEGLIDPVNGLDDFRIVIGDGDGAK